MPPWKVWMNALGKAIWQETPQAIAGIIPFGENFYRVGERFYKNLREAQSPSQDAPALQGLVSQTPEAIDAAAQEIADAVAVGQPPSVRQTLAQTLALAPVISRRSLRDVADPSGRSVPAALRLEQQSAVLPFVPHGPPRFQPGQAFVNGWVFRERLGMGGFGEVWKIEHPEDDELCAAVKFFVDDTARGRLGEHEVKMLRQVRKLGKEMDLVGLRNFDVKADPPWIEFDYIAGGDLLQYARFFFGSKSTELIRRVAATVGRCHRLEPPVVHRDLKPGNVLMLKKGDDLRPVIADFGIGGLASEWAFSQEKHSPRHSAQLPTMLSGSHTAGYASPQQRGGCAPDPRDDVYALGVMWYQLAIGDMTSDAPTGLWTEEAANQGLSAELIRVLGACVEPKKLDRRPKDGIELAERIEAALKKPTVEVPTAKGVSTPIPVTPVTKVVEVAIPATPVAETNPQQVTNSIGMKFARIPAGKFLMGETKELNPNAYGDESPRHEVTLTKAFYLGIYEVTQEQWEQVMGGNPSRFKGARRPVENVSWHQAMEFCKRLSELPQEKEKGYSYRLPTEAEWEYACRGGASEFSIYHFGNTITKENANFGRHVGETTEVGKYAPNAFGLYDMHGNVWEWCLDGPRAYQDRAETDPRGPAEGANRVIRGGSWDPGSSYCAASYRLTSGPDSRSYNVGFRLIRVSVRE